MLACWVDFIPDLPWQSFFTWWLNDFGPIRTADAAGSDLMSKRGIWTIVLIALAIITMLIERSLLGGLIGSFFIIVALTWWIVPGAAFGSTSSSNDPTTNSVSRTVPGVGLGLLAAAAAALLLLPHIISWLVILVGVMVIVWLVLQRRRLLNFPLYHPSCLALSR